MEEEIGLARHGRGPCGAIVRRETGIGAREAADRQPAVAFEPGIRERAVRAPAPDEAIALRDAWEFLTHIRIDLHFAAGKAQDRLTRDEQLRITAAMHIQPTPNQRAVEVFMQQYFRHTSEIIRIARRFSALNRRPSLKRGRF